MTFKKYGTFAAGVVGSALAITSVPHMTRRTSFNDAPSPKFDRPPSRKENIASLEATTRASPLDVLVIGGGATGTAVALDAQTRGLRTGLIERDDYASGTSSRSTKLIHGGVRYLEKAVFRLDLAQLQLVFEALKERAILIHQAPHLCHPIPTMLPCTHYWEVPWYFAGLKLYDLVAAVGQGTLDSSRVVRPGPTLDVFPKMKGGDLVGSIVYYDGQMDDARLNVAAALTASSYGAAVANHVEATKITQEDGVAVVQARDRVSGKDFTIYTRSLVNAAGPFTESVGKLSGRAPNSRVVPSAGAHVTLPKEYSPEGHAMLVPKTKDGRVVFLIRWLDHTIAGTTDHPTEVSDSPTASKDDVDFILESIRPYVGDVSRSEVLSTWSGIRPLAVDPNSTSTKEVVREHLIATNPEDRMLSITGGKWTTYRKMGKDVVDRLLGSGGLLDGTPGVGSCVTEDLVLVGGKSHVKKSSRPTNLDEDTWGHLQRSYGDRLDDVLEVAKSIPGGFDRLDGELPVIKGEINYAARFEHCETAQDFLCRRTRMAFLNTNAALRAAPSVSSMLSSEGRGGKAASSTADLSKHLAAEFGGGM